MQCTFGIGYSACLIDCWKCTQSMFSVKSNCVHKKTRTLLHLSKYSKIHPMLLRQNTLMVALGWDKFETMWMRYNFNLGVFIISIPNIGTNALSGYLETWSYLIQFKFCQPDYCVTAPYT